MRVRAIVHCRGGFDAKPGDERDVSNYAGEMLLKAGYVVVVEPPAPTKKAKAKKAKAKPAK